MKKLITPILFLLTLLCFLPSKAKADHCAASELLYEWVSDSTYRIIWKFYRDCSGIPEDATEPLCITNSCNPSANFQVVMNRTPAYLPDGRPNGDVLQHQCAGTLTSCDPGGGLIPGYREWWYTAIVTLPFRCNSWAFSVAPVARNSAVSNLASKGNLWTEATLDNLHFQGDSSPYFSVKPVPYVCNNYPYIYNNGAVDINSDSMYFSLNYPSGANCGDSFGTMPDTFSNGSLSAGYAVYNLTTNPLQCNNTFSLNHTNGKIAFTPNRSLVSVINVLVNTYRKGVHIGHVMRDIEIVVRNCSVRQPVINMNTTSITGGLLDANGNIDVCTGTILGFTFLASSDTGTILAPNDNHYSSIPGATITYTGFATDSVTGHFSWTPSVTDTGLKVLTVTVLDSTCRYFPDVITSQTFTLPIYVMAGIKAGNNATIVIGDTVHLHVTGSGTFTWSVLPGGAPLSSLSCTACSNPVATPSVTTKYIVTSSLVNACKKTDTVIITVKPKALVNEISGSVTINAVSPNPSIPDFKVWLIVHKTTPVDSLYAIDSVTVMGSSYTVNYQFLNEPAGTYLVKAALLNGPASGSAPAPTYHSTSIFWDSAISITYPGTGQSLNNNITMRQGVATTGPGFIAGTVTSGANKNTGGNAVPNLLVFLKDATGRLLSFTKTSATGTYTFSNLATGNYAVYPEAEGYKITPYVTSISSVTPFQNNINFIEHTISKTITPNTVGIENVIGSSAFKIAPNPTTGTTSVYWQQVPEREASLTVTDVLGRKVMVTKLTVNNASGDVQLDLSHQQPGVYLINIKTASTNYTSKIVLQK